MLLNQDSQPPPAYAFVANKMSSQSSDTKVALGSEVNLATPKTQMAYKDTTIRLVAYTVLFLLALAQFILGILGGTIARLRNPPVYVAMAFSILTMGALTVLAVFNKQRPSGCGQSLSKVATHAITIGAIAYTWLILSVFLTADAASWCPRRQREGRALQACNVTAPATVFSWLIWNIGLAVLMHLIKRGRERGFAACLDQSDGGRVVRSDTERGLDGRHSVASTMVELPK